MVWYLAVIPIAALIIVKLLIPYIRKRYVDDVITCSVCRATYSRREKGCPKCGIGRV